jgi:hypothetical protein
MKAVAVLVMMVGLHFGVAAAQEAGVVDIAPAQDGQFRESYDDSRPVSGSALVGLRLGDAKGRVSPDDIVLLRPLHGQRFCVHSITQDGRFSASNLYLLPSDAPPSSYVRLKPMTRAYGDKLVAYPMNQLAVRAFVPKGDNCSPAEALHIPEVADGGNLDVLYVFVSSRTQTVSAALSGQDGGAQVACEQAGDSAFIAYDQMCRIPLTLNKPGVAQLDLELNDGFSSRHYDYAVMLPGGS